MYSVKVGLIMPNQKSCLAECSDGEDGSTKGNGADRGEECSCTVLGGHDDGVLVLPVASTGLGVRALGDDLREHARGRGVRDARCECGAATRWRVAGPEASGSEGGGGGACVASVPVATACGQLTRDCGACAEPLGLGDDAACARPVVEGVAVPHAHCISVVDPEVVLVVVVLLPLGLVPSDVELAHTGGETGGARGLEGLTTLACAYGPGICSLERLRDARCVACVGYTSTGATKMAAWLL